MNNWRTIIATIFLSGCYLLSAKASKNIVLPTDELKLLPGFQAEIVAAFPKEQASIISLATDGQGHLLASSQNDKLFRIVPGKLGQQHPATSIHNLNVEFGGGHGLLVAFNSMYLVKADGTGDSGVYRLKDTDGKGNYSNPELILPIPGRGEHGGHGLVVGPHGKWIYLIAGNATGTPADLTADHTIKPKATPNYQVPKRQGWVIRFSPDGSQREMFCDGLRNAYDIAFNRQGDLFTFDSDNEGFMGLPWYRPANVYHLISGADYGWRQSPQNLMPYYPDTLPPVIEIGPGSPTGVVFGDKTHFPDKYQQAFYVCDWSYGRIYAVHLKSNGAGYKASWEFFASGTPLAVTDIVVGHDGALYFSTGGRGNPSKIYRIFHAQQNEIGNKIDLSNATKDLQKLSSLNTSGTPVSYESLAASLKSEDRTIRYAARMVLEHQPFEDWIEYTLTEPHATALLEGLTAATRQATPAFRQRLTDKLTSLQWKSLTTDQKLNTLRLFAIVLERMGMPEGSEYSQTLNYLNPLFPSPDSNINKELAKLLSHFQPEQFTDRILQSISESESLMTQLHFLSILMDEGIHNFTPEQTEQLMSAINPYELRAVAHRKYREQSEQLQQLIRTLGLPEGDGEMPSRPVVQNWKLTDLLPLASKSSLDSGNAVQGKVAFRAVRCDNCHRLGNAGGVLGPSLNGLSGRYTPQAILEHVVHPSRVISDQYQSASFILKDGRQLNGQIVNLSSGSYQVRTDPFRPFARTTIRTQDVEEVLPSKVSLMPSGLLDSLSKEEIRDLLVYLLDPE